MAYDTTILADSPIRYWKLRETTGITATDATAAFNGTYTPNAAGAWTGGTLNGTGPMAFGAPNFNGTTGYIYTGNVPLNSLAHVSFEFLVNLASPAPSYGTVFSKMDVAGPYPRVEVSTGGGGGYGVVNGIQVTIDNSTVVSSGVFSSGVWAHCVVVYDGTLAAADRVKCYVNGALTGLTALIGVIPATTPALATTDSYIGQRVGGTNFWSNLMAEISLYNVSLTQAQVTTHYNAALPTLFTAAVPTTGEKVNLTFSSAMGSVDITTFKVVSNNVLMELVAATGAGTAWSLPLATGQSGWVPATQSVKVSYMGSAGVFTSLAGSATNSSTVTQAQQRYVERGFGIFVHLSYDQWAYAAGTWPYPPTITEIALIDMPSYDMEQWFTSVIVPVGARYAVLTTKHDAGFCLWPTASGTFNIAQTAFGASHPGADLVRDWVRLCRKYNIAVGLYLNWYDPWWTTSRPGADGGYTNPAYITYMNQQITELFSNYGKIDMLWIDALGYSIGYANYPWAQVVGLRDSLQPGCVLANNAHEGSSLTHNDIAVYEGSGAPGPAPPTSSNVVPSEFSEDARPGDTWVWHTGEDTYKDVYTIAAKVQTFKAARCAYLLNFPPNASGLMPTSTGTYAAQLGSIIGKQGGNPVVPALPNVRYGIDRGDGQTGAWGGGINSSAILGLA